MSTYNLKNYAEQPVLQDPNGDNAYHFGGTVYLETSSLYVNGVLYSSAQLENVIKSNVATVYSTAIAIATSGKAVITGGTGLALTLAAPTVGCECDIYVQTLASGAVTVTLPAGVTFDGTNNTATIATAGLILRLNYKSATRWQISYNTGATFSVV